MLAILEDAIRAYLGPVPRSQEEAALWIADSRSRWVFSFPVVCETLGLEPSAVRTAVRRMHDRYAMAPPLRLDRSRPNSRRHAGLGIAIPPAGSQEGLGRTGRTSFWRGCWLLGCEVVGPEAARSCQQPTNAQPTTFRSLRRGQRLGAGRGLAAAAPPLGLGVGRGTGRLGGLQRFGNRCDARHDVHPPVR